MSLAAFPYSLFSTKFKKMRIRYAEPGEAVLELYRTRISEEFALFMQEEGFCTYLNGLFTTVNPLAYTKVMEAFGINSAMVVPLLKNGFGDVFFFDGVSIRLLLVSHNEKHVLGSSSDAVKMLFVMRITEADFQNPFLKKKLFNQAVKLYGALEPHESFGFIQPLWDGGKEKPENVVKVDSRNYVETLLPKES